LSAALTPALVLFGPPGSGKGTQAKLLLDRLQIPHVSTGDMLREHIRLEDAIGLEVRALMGQGNLVPDSLVLRMVEERLAQPDAAAGVILDGFPRTLKQAEALGPLLASVGMAWLVVHLKVDYNKLTARLTGRRACPQCGTLYNIRLKPPIVDGRCDIEGARLVIRDDDKENVIRQRLSAYDAQTLPLLEFFGRGTGRFFEVDSSDRAPQEIAEEIERIFAAARQA
jgi:adenylate kinase